MINIVYLALILVVAFYAIFSGFRKGITGQIASLLGFGFGAVGARILTPEYSYQFQWAAKMSQTPEFNELTVNLVCAIIIYTIIYFLFSFLSFPFRRIFSFIYIGMFNRIVGAFFSITKNLLWLSIFFNLLLCFSSSSGLLKYERANDGNLVAAIISLTPAILGCAGGEDFAHFNQLKEAKYISCNFNGLHDVIILQG